MSQRLTVCGLHKSFGCLEVLRDVGFTLDRSESLAVVGPSGCGKTTLLRILLGLESLDAGWFSQTLDRTGYLPQGAQLFPWKRVMENIELPLQLQGVRRKIRRAAVRAHLSVFGLEGFERSYPYELSGGMQQRVALLRAVSAGARTLLLDEPFGALDTVTRQRLQDWLLEVLARVRCSLVFVTHDLEEAVVLAQRIVVLSERPAEVLGEISVKLSSQERSDRLSEAFLRARQSLVDLILSRSSGRRGVDAAVEGVQEQGTPAGRSIVVSKGANEDDLLA